MDYLGGRKTMLSKLLHKIAVVLFIIACAFGASNLKAQPSTSGYVAQGTDVERAQKLIDSQFWRWYFYTIKPLCSYRQAEYQEFKDLVKTSPTAAQMFADALIGDMDIINRCLLGYRPQSPSHNAVSCDCQNPQFVSGTRPTEITILEHLIQHYPDAQQRIMLAIKQHNALQNLIKFNQLPVDNQLIASLEEPILQNFDNNPIETLNSLVDLYNALHMSATAIQDRLYPHMLKVPLAQAINLMVVVGDSLCHHPKLLQHLYTQALASAQTDPNTALKVLSDIQQKQQTNQISFNENITDQIQKILNDLPIEQLQQALSGVNLQGMQQTPGFKNILTKIAALMRAAKNSSISLPAGTARKLLLPLYFLLLQNNAHGIWQEQYQQVTDKTQSEALLEIQDGRYDSEWVQEKIQEDNRLSDMIDAMHAAEYQDTQANRFTFIHGQQRQFGFYEDVYTALKQAQDTSLPKDYLFIRYPKQTSEPIDLHAARAQRLKLMRGRQSNNGDRGPELFFMNAFITGGTSGANTLEYFIRNSSVYYPNLSTEVIFANLNLAHIYNKHQQTLAELEAEYKELSPYGRMLQVAVPTELMDDVVYMSRAGGYKIKSITAVPHDYNNQGMLNQLGNKIAGMISQPILPVYSSPRSLLEAVRGNPTPFKCITVQDVDPYYQDDRVYGIHCKPEFVLVLTDDIALNPRCGIKIRAFEAVEQAKWQSYQHKFNRIMAEIIKDLRA